MNKGGQLTSSIRDPKSLQIATLNTFMGSLFSIFVALVVKHYLTSLIWVLLLVGVVWAIAWGMVRRLKGTSDIYIVLLNVLLLILFAFAVHTRMQSSLTPLSIETFWPVFPVLIYPMWILLLELILRGKV